MSAQSEEKDEDFDNDENEDVEQEQEEEEEGEQQKNYMEVDELVQMKITPGDIKKLKEANYYTVESIAYTPKKILLEIKGISDAKVEKLQDAGFVNINIHYIPFKILRTRNGLSPFFFFLFCIK